MCIDMELSGYSYLDTLVGSRRPQVFVREGRKELCHTHYVSDDAHT